MTEKKEFQVNKNTPFWDASLTDQERIDWLLKEMTVEEKLGYLASFSPDLPRLGIPGVSVGGEAAHGVEGRNDQNGLGTPDVTTSFPQPIGMSASWDPELIKKAGEVTGTEARVVWHRHQGHGLSRWAPTVDLERDPRWGRNEEGYGEDPVLTGKMAGAYIQGMQGDDPKYLRCASTLKHFYGNNTEVGRGWKNSSIDPRNKYELYLEPFRRCIEEGGAEGIMTAYNKINGTVGILNPEVTDILKKQYGLKHVVSDGGAMALVVTLQHYFGQHAETIATALKAGVDAMSDDPRMVEKAAGEAYALGILKEEDMDRAIRCMMETKLRLGVYDRENLNPYDRVTEEDIDSPAAREICKELSRESIVLLKNENHMLPLSSTVKAEDLAIVGPLGDAWYQDWYGGTAPYRKTFLQGMEELKKEKIAFADGLDRVVFRCRGKALALAEDGTLQTAEEPDVFVKENWGEGSYTFKSVRTGKYLCARLGYKDKSVKIGQIAADQEEAFDWFVMEIFHMEPQEDGTVILLNRFHHPVYQGENGFFSMDKEEGTPITMEVVENGIEKAAALAKEKKVVLLALGCNSVINAKEEIDRNTMDLPDDQETLLEKVAEVNPNTAMVLFTNYPYTMTKAKELLPAIIMSATGSQDMGSAMAEAVLGVCAPAGRLNMTWYQSMDQLPDIDDYDIIKGKRTYRYFDGDVLYPFGYGLTYTTFAYDNYKVSLKDNRLLQISLTVTNTGDTASDEVVQVYGSAPASRVKKPICQLLGFQRVKQVMPGETRQVALEIPVEELRFYDVISRKLMVEEGTYEIYAGASCKDKAVSAQIFVPGGKTGVRDLTVFTAADHYDDYENMYLTEGHFNFKAVRVQDESKEGVLVYRDCGLDADANILALHVKSERGGSVEAFVDGVSVGSFSGDTRTCEFRSAPKLDRYAEDEVKERNRYREPVYEDIEISLADRPQTDGASEIRLVLTGDMRICYLRVLQNKSTGKIHMGVAN